jgi:hypothetical protein
VKRPCWTSVILLPDLKFAASLLLLAPIVVLPTVAALPVSSAVEVSRSARSYVNVGPPIDAWLPFESYVKLVV